MTDKRYLFRGFHHDENGKTVITFNGEKIRGEWVYWNKFGYLIDINIHDMIWDEEECTFLRVNDEQILEETVGQWVTTDKNGKDVFEGDFVKVCSLKGGNDNTEIKVVEWDSNSLCYEFYRWSGDIHWIELVGNKWSDEI